MNSIARRQGNVLTITLPLRLQSVNNVREHWAARAKRRKSQRGPTTLAVAYYAREIGLPAAVTLTRVAPRSLDGDNLQASFKSIRDGIADAFGVDDRDLRITWHYAQRRGAPKEYAVEIAIAGPIRHAGSVLDEPPPSGVSLTCGDE